jgi:hypothetical protein
MRLRDADAITDAIMWRSMELSAWSQHPVKARGV